MATMEGKRRSVRAHLMAWTFDGLDGVGSGAGLS
jgi:hypothetical protein